MGSTAEAGRFSLHLPDEAATARLAEDIAAVLRAGDLVALSGGLGAGKTSFARALIRALAADPALEVPSPTFPLRIEHLLPRLKVVHADLYRIGDAAELDELGLDEALEDSALLVEWPEPLPAGQTETRLDVRL
jgi:tRNA threonylcarbamoyl adenosine modification protein YjeE